MQVVPVIDIKAGAVVHARAGNRAEYRPIESLLAKSADPLDVIAGLRALYPFDALYVADLDGLESGTPDILVQERILEAWPGSRVLIDDGRRRDQIPLPHVRHSAVLGSETVHDLGDLAGAEVLSLDFKGDVFLGPMSLLDHPDEWPSEVIVMTLGSVGMGSGPDVLRLREMLARAHGRTVFAAGGVRDAEDLRTLKGMGVKGVLVATALHTGQIKTRDLVEIAGESF